MLCNAEPTTRAEAVVTFALADVAMVAGDFTKANGDTSGRKVTIAAKYGVPIDVSDMATHIALVDATRLLYVTTCVLKTAHSGRDDRHTVLENRTARPDHGIGGFNDTTIY